MAIILKNSWNVPPVRWGSFEDIQYAIKVNAEKIYGVDPDSFVLNLPLFWGLPILDYSSYKIPIVNYNVKYRGNGLYFGGSSSASHLEIHDKELLAFEGATEDFTVSMRFTPHYLSSHQILIMKGDANDDFWRVHLWDNNRVVCSLDAIDFATSIGRFVIGGQYSLINVFNKSGNGQIYVDGSPSGSSVALNNEVLALANQYMQIGCSSYGPTFYYFLGYIYELHIAKKVYTPEQIALFSNLPYALYQKVIRPFYFFPMAPTGWTGKINTVTNPSKIMGVSIEDITKVNSIASA